MHVLRWVAGLGVFLVFAFYRINKVHFWHITHPHAFSEVVSVHFNKNIQAHFESEFPELDRLSSIAYNMAKPAIAVL